MSIKKVLRQLVGKALIYVVALDLLVALGRDDLPDRSPPQMSMNQY